MRRPPEPPPFDDDSLAEELLDAEPDVTDFEDDAEAFDPSLMDDEPDIPDEPFDFAGPYEPAEPDLDELGDEEDAAPDLRTAGDARRYAKNLTVVEDDNDSDDAARFLTYRNYVGALALILREQYGAAPWLPLAKAVRDLPGVQRIQRRPLPDLDRKRAARELRGAWAYELSMSPPSELFAIDVPDLVMIANHTAGVHAHYAIYKMCRALALALGLPMPEEHERHLDIVEQQFLRRGLMPSPWDARCDKGGAPRSRKRGAHAFQAFPSGTITCPNLWRASTDTMWSLLATALKTTRDRSRGFESDLDNWRRQNRSKAAKAGRTKGHKRWVPYDVQDSIYSAMRPTNVVDFVYRMRRRSSYLDDSSFLNNRIGMQDAIGFNRDLLLWLPGHESSGAFEAAGWLLAGSLLIVLALVAGPALRDWRDSASAANAARPTPLVLPTVIDGIGVSPLRKIVREAALGYNLRLPAHWRESARTQAQLQAAAAAMLVARATYTARSSAEEAAVATQYDRAPTLPWDVRRCVIERS